jgi:uncharacterized protein (TIGR00730 family)
MNPAAFSICVYCGSKPGADERFAQTAIAVGRWIGEHGGRLVYGGGRNGLMGLAADATLQASGQVLGIIPQALVEKEWAHTGCSELVVVQTMHERKQKMADAADVFLALPGGIGTFEEFFEAWTWRQLGYHDKPVGLLNTAGYYDRMLDFLAHSVESGFMGDWQRDLIKVSESHTALLPELVQDAGLAPAARTELY